MRRYIIGIDPSGSFDEGKGITGFCILDSKTKRVLSSTQIRAKQFDSAEEYWNAHMDYIDAQCYKYKEDVIVSMEDFRIYANKAKSLTNSTMETSQLIGAIRIHCYLNSIPLTMRLAVVAKKRWTNAILEHKGIIHKVGRGWANELDEPLVSHTLDAIRHAVHCMHFENKEED